MPNMQKILAEEIRRLARKELKAALAPLAKQNKALKEQLADQAKRLKELSKAVAAAAAAPKVVSAPAAKETPAPQPAGKKAPKRHFRPADLVAFRKKHAFSQRIVAKLLSTSLVTVTNWENGHAVPRPALLAKSNALRKMGKRQLLKLIPDETKKVSRKPRFAKAGAPAAKPAVPAPEKENPVPAP